MPTENTVVNENALVVLSEAEIALRVNSTNKFTKDEMAAHKAVISKCRKEKRVTLGAMSTHEQDARISSLREQGFTVLHDVKFKDLSTGERVVVEFKKAKPVEQERATLRDQLAAALKEIEALKATLATPAVATC
jgi:hypothetical protein